VQETIESANNSATENQTASDLESIELFPSTSLIFSEATTSNTESSGQEKQASVESFIYSYIPAQGDSIQIRTELAVETEEQRKQIATSKSVEMLKTSYSRPSLLDKFNESKVKFKEIDVIGKLNLTLTIGCLLVILNFFFFYCIRRSYSNSKSECSGHTAATAILR